MIILVQARTNSRLLISIAAHKVIWKNVTLSDKKKSPNVFCTNVFSRV